MLLELTQSLISKLGIIVISAFLLSKSSLFKRYILKETLSLRDKILSSILFGLVGIIGTYTGIPIDDAIANSRSIGVIVAGLFGGPAVGIGAGLIAGIHRMLMPYGKFTAIACGISTILGGIIAGYLKKYVDSHPKKWLCGFFIAALIEILQMGIILIMAKPFDQALRLVEVIFLPMTFINASGTAAFILLIQQIHEENDRAGAVKAQLALSIATKTLPFFRNGLNQTSCKAAANIIYEAAGVDAVSFTNTEFILAHIGVGSDHHEPGHIIHTNLTKKVILSKQYMIGQGKLDIECPVPTCKLKACIIVPLFIKDNVMGTLKLYKKFENSITSSDIELAKGLAHLFSTQLELSEISYQKELLNKAEIKALQAQIQPHFLFNALNTIVSFCRTDTQKARDLLMQLSYYLRNSFKATGEFINLAQELKHIESYLSIEQARFSERLQIRYDIDPKLDCLVPPLILQPIVENALKHGLMATKQGGRLEIHAHQNNSSIIIQVKDNGIGMSPDRISKLLDGTDEAAGIGIQNVNDRLKSIYGTTLQIDSSIDQGTSVTLTFPQGGVSND